MPRWGKTPDFVSSEPVEREPPVRTVNAAGVISGVTWWN